MKTPKRDYFATAANAYDMFNTPGTSNKLSARWKRKNRVARLKAKIARLTAENKWLSEERSKYIEFYFNALRDLVNMREELIQKKRNRKEKQQ